jgi:hypothetical protein
MPWKKIQQVHVLRGQQIPLQEEAGLIGRVLHRKTVLQRDRSFSILHMAVLSGYFKLE